MFLTAMKQDGDKTLFKAHIQSLEDIDKEAVLMEEEALQEWLIAQDEVHKIAQGVSENDSMDS